MSTVPTPYGERPVVPDLRRPEGPVLRRVVLSRVPLLVWERSSRHVDELLREFHLLTIGLAEGAQELPAQLLELVAELQVRYAGVSDDSVRRREQALAEGRRELEMVHEVPPEAAEACATLAELLDAADRYCATDALMTLPAPADQVAFRRWYLGEFVRQVAGEAPQPWDGPLD